MTADQQHQRDISTSQETDVNIHPRYMGISLPQKLNVIFPEATPTEVLLRQISKYQIIHESSIAQVIIITCLLFYLR